MGLGAAVANPKIIDAAVEELRAITGQKPVVTRAKKAIANFKLREGIPIGAMVTLRSERMWEFLDRLVTLALPRTRDFKGVSRKAFDGKGNYTLGLKEQIIFPEIDYDKIDAIKGLNISFVTTARRPTKRGARSCSSSACRSARPERARREEDQWRVLLSSRNSIAAPKFAVRHRNRCKVCGRARGYYRKFELCRICLRLLALRGEIPGVIKASW